MYLIFPDGRIETKKYESYKSIGEGVNLETGGRDDPFTTVPLPGGFREGYSVFANDNGLLVGLPRNPTAEKLAQYPELAGVIVVASFKESGEDDLLCYVDHEVRRAFEAKLQALMAPAN
jgi:hypothetical protein